MYQLPHDVAIVALAPGFVRTERVLAAFAAAGRVPGNLESAEYIGRAVVALAGDVNVMAKLGCVLTVGQRPAVAAVPDRSLTGIALTGAAIMFSERIH